MALGMTLLAGCDWVSLASHAWTYPTLAAGEAGNVVAGDSLAYVTLGDSGLAIIELETGTRAGLIPPPAGSESVDDVALEGSLLFALDARPPGHLAVLSLRDPRRPVLVGTPSEVPVGPFSGVSAREGLCVVSGGTSSLTLWRYDAGGALTGPTATADYGRGQPDVLVARGFLLVSTHYWGPYFGIDVVAPSLLAPEKLDLDGAGFSDGGAKPANFPIQSALADDSTVLVAHAGGVSVIHVRAGKPVLSQTLDLGGHAVAIALRDRVAAVTVAAPASAVVTLDLSATTPRVLTRTKLSPGTNPLGVALSRRRVIVAARDKGVLLFPR